MYTNVLYNVWISEFSFCLHNSEKSFRKNETHVEEKVG